MNPTLDEMKLAVARILPEVIQIPTLQTPGSFNARWKDTGRFIAGREWLHVCWLAEETLNGLDWALYDSAICRVCSDRLSSWGRIGIHLHASADDRLEALCRVRHPEMFTGKEGAE